MQFIYVNLKYKWIIALIKYAHDAQGICVPTPRVYICLEI